ncbi:hypothetical protein HWV62_13175 [Athelia sp. TMB]|nr:hypothetical protein HWV62_35658 [Athelia sp. TMB]KAF7974207.1 hypothetical protein HWV62_13175 [Athelia sp. TMB]
MNQSAKALSALTQAAAYTLVSLQLFQQVAGDAYPRAFLDTATHLKSIMRDADSLKQARVKLEGKIAAELQRSVDVCMAQLRLLDGILEKYNPGQKQGARLTAKAVKELYKEQGIPRVQKTLMGFEGVFADMASNLSTERG